MLANFKIVGCLLSFAAFVVFAPATAQQLVYVPRDGFCIHGKGINFPIGQFLLIRKGDQLGALRLTQVMPDTTTKPRGTEWLGKVSYESYFTSGGQSQFTQLTTKRQAGTLTFGRFKGFGFHYSWQSGDQTATVGPWKFAFFDANGMYMTAVDFWHGINDDSGLEFAPTTDTDPNKINPNDPHLHWFHVDNNADMPCPIAVSTQI